MKKLEKILGILVMLVALTMIVFIFIYWFDEETAIIRLASLYLAYGIATIIFAIGFTMLRGKSE